MRSIVLGTTLVLAAAGCSKDKNANDKNKVAGPTAPGAGTAAAPGATAPGGGTASAPGTTTPPAEGPSSPVLGKPAPDFTLEALDGSKVSLASHKGKVVVLEWFNPGCPFVQRAHGKGSLVGTAKRHTDAGVVWLAINSAAEGKQ